MKKPLGVAAAVAALLLSSALVQPASAAPSPNELGVKVVSHLGTDESLAAHLTDADGVGVPNEKISLQRKTGSGWDGMTAGRTDFNGDVYFDYLNSTHSQVYRAVSGDVRSGTVSIAQAAKTPPSLRIDAARSTRSGSRVVFAGRVDYVSYRFIGGRAIGVLGFETPVGLHVQLQQSVRGGWRTVATSRVESTTSGSDDLAFSVVGEKSSWRLAYPGSSGYAPAYSAAVTR